jgi:hypothetical protein
MAHAAIVHIPGTTEEALQQTFSMLLPGSHVVIWSTEAGWVDASLMARRVGLHFRDTLAVLTVEGWHPLMLFRKPLQEKTIVKQVLSTGTGAINIDATRVKHASKADFERHKAGVDALKAKGGSLGNSWKNSSDLSGANDVTLAGRFPANLVLLHAPGCRQVGTRKVDAPTINRFEDGMKPFGHGAGHSYKSIKTGDENGQEEIPVCECDEGCPILELDQQSGQVGCAHSSPKPSKTTSRNGVTNFGARQGALYSDDGGAARFFRQFFTVDEVVGYMTTMILPPDGELVVL